MYSKEVHLLVSEKNIIIYSVTTVAHDQIACKLIDCVYPVPVAYLEFRS